MSCYRSMIKALSLYMEEVLSIWFSCNGLGIFLQRLPGCLLAVLPSFENSLILLPLYFAPSIIDHVLILSCFHQIVEIFNQYTWFPWAFHSIDQNCGIERYVGSITRFWLVLIDIDWGSPDYTINMTGHRSCR